MLMRPDEVQPVVEARDIKARAISREEIEQLRKLFEISQFISWCALLGMTHEN